MNNCKKCGLPIEEGQEYCADCMPTEEEQVQIEELHECSVLENEEPTKKGGVFTTIAVILASISIGILVFSVVITVLLSLFGLGVLGALLSGLSGPLALAALVLGIVACVKKEGKKGLVMGIIAFALPIVLLIVGLAISLVLLVISGVFMFAFYLMEEVFYY